MPVVLHISGFVRANKPNNAETVLQRLSSAIGYDLSACSCEPYWKDSALFSFGGDIELDEMSFRDAYVDVPARFSAVSGRWSMTLPRPGVDEAPSWDFEAGCHRTSISGVESLSFSVRREP